MPPALAGAETMRLLHVRNKISRFTSWYDGGKVRIENQH